MILIPAGKQTIHNNSDLNHQFPTPSSRPNVIIKPERITDPK